MWNVMQETMAKLYNGEVGTAKDRVAEAASYFQENYKTLLETMADNKKAAALHSKAAAFGGNI